MAHLTPFVAPLLGGALIGTAATVLWVTLCRVAGVSGIVGNLITLRRAGESWQLGFVIGLLFVGWALLGRMHLQGSATAPAALVAAGLLVGFGTRLGNGCTSGHGVCGLSRLSPRSLVATGTFMLTAMVVVVLARHVFAVGAP